MRYLWVWISVGVLFIIGLIVGLSSFEIVEAHEFGYVYDLRTGDLKALMTKDGRYKTGLIWKVPFVEKVHTIDLRPKQVCIGSQRVLNCKLIKFDPRGYKIFVQWHGRRDYYYNNQGSGVYSGDSFDEILKNYAYDEDPTQYPFLIITKEIN